MMPSKIPLWKDCVVRIDINKKPKGTGFFVDTGLVLTCHHVVRNHAVEEIVLQWNGQSVGISKVSIPDSTVDVDLALLTLSELVPGQSSVVFNDVLADREPLQTFGYPEKRPNGDPGTFEYEGMTGDPLPLRLIKFKGGQVVPGFSGSPLVQEKSQKVCGLIKTTRDRHDDLGGRAIPVQVIWQVFPQLKPLNTLNTLQNPFGPISGCIDKPDQFWGRTQELRDIFEILNSGSSVAVVGERQVGKSSLLKAIARQANTKLWAPRYPVYLNLQDVTDEADFYEALCEKLEIQTQKGSALRRAVGRLDPKVLLLLDEVEKMTWDGFTEQIRSQLRGLADGSDAPLRLVVAASVSLDHLFPDSKGGVSPLKGLCVEECLRPWDDSQIRELVAHRLMDHPICFSEEEISEIIKTSNGNPQQVMHACFDLYRSRRDSFMIL